MLLHDVEDMDGTDPRCCVDGCDQAGCDQAGCGEDAERDELAVKFDARGKQFADMFSQLNQANMELDRACAERDEARTGLSNALYCFDDLQSVAGRKYQELEGERDLARAELVSARAELVSARAELDAVNGEWLDVKVELAETRAELAQARDAHALAGELLLRARTELDGVRAVVNRRAADLHERADREPIEPSACSQVFLKDVDTATPEDLRAEVRRLDLRLRWMHTHYDDEATTFLLTAYELGDQRDALRTELDGVRATFDAWRTESDGKLKRLREAHDSAVDELGGARNELERTRIQMATAYAELADADSLQLCTECGGFTGTPEGYQAALRIELDGVRQALAERAAKVEDLEATLAMRTGQLTACRAAFDSWRDEADAVRTARDNLGRQLAAAHTEIQQLDAQLDICARCGDAIDAEEASTDG
jgi:chromosome segregation ATPase